MNAFDKIDRLRHENKELRRELKNAQRRPYFIALTYNDGKGGKKVDTFFLTTKDEDDDFDEWTV